jgi:hypothetical protein
LVRDISWTLGLEPSLLDCGDDLEDLNRFTVRKVPHGSDRCSYWIFTPSGELHLPSVEALKKYGPSSQQTYAYSLVDHHNWALLNGKTPSNVTIDDLQRYMKVITGDATGIYGIAWRRKGQGPVGPSAACNVAAIVKAYYIAVLRDGSNDKLIEELTTATVATPRGRSRQGRSKQIRSLPGRRHAGHDFFQIRWCRHCLNKVY